MVPSTMNHTILLILVLTCAANGALAGFIDDINNIKSAIDWFSTEVKKLFGVFPKTNTAAFGNTIGLPVVPWVAVPELIKNEGYPSESHYVTTKDGYILNIHRIPHGKNNKINGKVIYLQHGLLAASSDWVLFGPNKSLAYILADAGFDVWMGNVRGNLYSRNHTSLSPDDKEFWDFSWHEIGIIDVPTIIDYILQKTGSSNLFHIGHSQGTTSFFVMVSEKPEYNKKIIAHISLAPMAFMNHLFSPLMRLMGTEAMHQDNLLQIVGKYEFTPNFAFLNMLTDVTCSQGVGKILCKNPLFAIGGFSPNQMNACAIPLLMAHYPAGAATKQFVHYGQEIISGQFRQFDYGLNNYNHYSTNSPPDYKLEKISCPIFLVQGHNNWLAADSDVKKFFNRTPGAKAIVHMPNETWNHLDFLFGNDAPKYVYYEILQILSKYIS